MANIWSLYELKGATDFSLNRIETAVREQASVPVPNNHEKGFRPSHNVVSRSSG
jgi:hypothetical protein